jgi:hypothetical protein
MGAVIPQQHRRNGRAILDVPTLGEPEVFHPIKEDFLNGDGILANADTKKFQQGWPVLMPPPRHAGPALRGQYARLDGVSAVVTRSRKRTWTPPRGSAVTALQRPPRARPRKP